jgi:branched-chain amino acid transport system permease protein
MTGLGLLFFGAEGFRNPSFWDARFNLGPVAVTGQAVIIVGVSLALIGLLWQFFEHTLYGKALARHRRQPHSARA